MANRNAAELGAGAVVLVVAVGFLGYAVAHTGRSTGSGDLLHARFERIDGLVPGAEVRVAGVKVGSVVASRLDSQTFQATVDFTVTPSVQLPKDTSAAITSDGLLGSKYLSLVPGGDTATIPKGGTVAITQSSISIEDLLGKFIFSAANLADDARKKANGGAAPAKPAAGQAPAGQAPAGGSGELPPLVTKP